VTSQNGPVEVYKQIENGTLKIGVHFEDSANLQDLLDVWQPLCDDRSIYKRYAPSNFSQCKGCQVNCCNTAYVIPDLVSFRRMADLINLSYAEFIAQYFEMDKLQAGLLRMKPNPCVFLQDNICTIYPARSLICRFYICTSLLPDTEELIYKIAWSGSAATQLFAEAKGLIPLKSNSVSSFDRLFLNLIEEYRREDSVNIFLQAQNYADIPLAIFKPL
jgi:Fe-S-cluster containining protein